MGVAEGRAEFCDPEGGVGDQAHLEFSSGKRQAKDRAYKFYTSPVPTTFQFFEDTESGSRILDQAISKGHETRPQA